MGSYLSLLTGLRGHDGKGSATTRAELMSMRRSCSARQLDKTFKTVECPLSSVFPLKSPEKFANSPEKVNCMFISSYFLI